MPDARRITHFVERTRPKEDVARWIILLSVVVVGLECMDGYYCLLVILFFVVVVVCFSGKSGC